MTNPARVAGRVDGVVGAAIRLPDGALHRRIIVNRR